MLGCSRSPTTCRFSSNVSAREPNLDFQSTAISIAGASATAIENCYSLCDRQAQTGSSGLVLASLRDPIEGLKNTSEGFRRNTIAMVRDENSRGVRTLGDGIQGDRHLRLWLGVVNGVADYVFNATAQKRRIPSHPTIVDMRNRSEEHTS